MPAEIEDWPSDEVLLQQARSGNRTAFARFATRWWGPLYRIAWNMLGNASEAAGATQRALRLVVRFPGSRVCDASFRAAMYGVAIEVTLQGDPSPERFSAESLEFLLPRFDARGCLASPVADWSDLAEELSQRPDLPETIREMLQRLDGLDRAAFLLREIEQFSVAETAAILRISRDEARARTHRATLLLNGLFGRILRRRQQQSTNLDFAGRRSPPEQEQSPTRRTAGARRH
jgi:RNA polymerase sigma-70 factor (ECF subfamily)